MQMGWNEKYKPAMVQKRVVWDKLMYKIFKCAVESASAIVHSHCIQVHSTWHNYPARMRKVAVQTEVKDLAPARKLLGHGSTVCGLVHFLRTVVKRDVNIFRLS